MGLRLIATFCLLLSLYNVTGFSEHLDYYNAVVIEAKLDHTLHRLPREAETIKVLATEGQFYLIKNSPSTDSNLVLTNSCYTSKGAVGRCLSFRQCYPFFKLPNLNSWENWILGMYDTCSYFTPQGRQMFGVCCPNPDKENSETSQQSTDLPTTIASTTNPNEQNLDINKFPNYPNWPPPLPTHSPENTYIPPLPTHPSSTFILPQPTAAVETPISSTPKKPDAIANFPFPLTTEATVGPVVNGSCGTKNGYQDQERIVGGHNADLAEWPWIAGLYNAGRQFCGGSLIDDIHILSAAHCVAHMSSWDVARLTVRLGDHNIKTNTEISHIEQKVKRVVRHKGFDARTLYNDISIITMEKPVKFAQHIRPICLPSSTGDTYSGTTATVIGWGSLRESGPQPAILQEVNIPIWSNKECRYKYGGAAPGGIVEHMLCAGQANRDSCSGDSGGPLMVNNGRWIQVGIVSWGIGCGKGQYPGVYSRVQSFLTWIHKNLK